MIQFTATTIRTLKGCPLSVVVALMLTQAPTSAQWLERSPALVTALAPKVGYAEAAKLAKESLARNLTVRQLVEEKGILKGRELDEVLDYRAMTEIGVPGKK